jgi:uncharacterized protein DUF6789
VSGHAFWKVVIAGLCGTAAHSTLMYLKFRMGWLPAFQPYRSLQLALTQWAGSDVHPIVPWALSFVNGSAILSFVFARTYRLIPGKSGVTKGLIYGFCGWMVVGTVAFPLLGLGPFAAGIGLGLTPALFSLAMLLTYSVVLGSVYATLGRR